MFVRAVCYKTAFFPPADLLQQALPVRTKEAPKDEQGALPQ
jgi:hypothetical protein